MFVTGSLFIPCLIFASKAGVGNCDIHAEEKISVMNETKWYETWSKLKVLVKKNFRNLLPNFFKGHNKCWLECCPFCLY